MHLEKLFVNTGTQDEGARLEVIYPNTPSGRIVQDDAKEAEDDSPKTEQQERCAEQLTLFSSKLIVTESKESSNAQRFRGQVKHWNVEKGYGFIEAGDGEED